MLFSKDRINIKPFHLEDPESKHEADNAYLVYAIKNNLEAIVRVFLTAGADPNCFGGAPTKGSQGKGLQRACRASREVWGKVIWNG